MVENKRNLSVIILTKNEAVMIGECLDSLALLRAQEVIVIDDSSTDDTSTIAHFKGVKVINHKKQDFAEARNFASNKSKCEWLLYIDADERLTEELSKEINEIIDESLKNFSGYSIPRINYYFSKKWPKIEYLVRLIKKKTLIGWYGPVHESPRIKGEIGKIKSPLLHYTHRNISEMVENTLVWSEIEARLHFQANHPRVTWWRFLRVMITTFMDYYFKQGGFKVGTVGFIESIYQSFSIFITYAKLWEMQQDKTLNSKS